MRYLVVVNETLGIGPLLDEVAARNDREPSEFVVVVPASIPTEGFMWTEGEARGLAQDRLDRVLQHLSDRGIKADGRIAGVDPFLAIEDNLRGGKFDEIILASPPSSLKSRTKGDLVQRVRKASGVPVTFIPSERENVTREATLGRVPLFADLPKRHLRVLAKESMFNSYREGEPIVEAGSSGADLHVIIAGSVKVIRGGRNVGRMVAGDIFGEIALLDPGPRTATVVADAPTRCLSLPGKAFRQAVDRDAALAKNLLQAAGKRMRELASTPATDVV